MLDVDNVDITTSDFAGFLTDKTLRQIARKAHGKLVDLGIELDLDWVDIKTLQREHSDAVDLTFHILMVSSTFR